MSSRAKNKSMTYDRVRCKQNPKHFGGSFTPPPMTLPTFLAPKLMPLSFSSLVDAGHRELVKWQGDQSSDGHNPDYAEYINHTPYTKKPFAGTEE